MNITDSLSERRVRFKPLARERGRFTCPCCGYPSLRERHAYEICPICFWEDDGQDDAEANEVWGGPNKDYSLAEARANFERFGTMYAKRHRQRFEKETGSERERTKHRLIRAYEAIEATRPGPERDAAWKQAERIE
jgi:hypothetical protein